MTSLDWNTLARATRDVNPHLFRKNPEGLTATQVSFFDSLDAAVEAALAHPDLAQLDSIAELVCTRGATGDMAVLNLLLELYRGLKLQYYERETSALDLRRVRRALFQELWHLVRRRVQARLGRPVKAIEYLLFEQGPLAPQAFFAWCDGSYRYGKGYAGFVLRDAQRCLLATGSIRIPADSGHRSEVHALKTVLHTALALGISALHVHVDATGLGPLAAGLSSLRYCVEESEIQHLIASFTTVRITKVPRIYNSEADALSRRLKD